MAVTTLLGVTSQGRDTMDSVLQDFRVSLRTLLKQPGFASVVILTLAVGIGASTVIFSVVKAVQFDPLPYPNADRLVNINLDEPATGLNQLFMSYPEYEDLRDRSQTLEEVAGYTTLSTVTLTGRGNPQRLSANFVTPSFFEVLGVEPVLGRRFGPEDHRTPNGHPLVILSHGLWQRTFGGSPGVIGQAVNLSGTPYTVIGVMPSSHFDVTGGANQTQVWLPIMQIPRYWRDDGLTIRRGRVFGSIARLKPGVTLEQAAADLDNLGSQLEEEFPEFNKGIFIRVSSLQDFFFNPVQTPAYALLIGAGMLLLIGCANVAGLLLIRATGRQKESALRLALGASRARLVRQLAAESLVMVLLAGSLGILLAHWALKPLVAFSPVQLPAFVDLKIDVTVLFAAIAISLLSGLLTGMAPAFASVRVDLRDALTQGGDRSSGSRAVGWTRGLLVVAEVAMAVVVLVGTALMVQTSSAFARAEIGFRPDHLLTLRLDLQSAKYAEPQARRNMARQLTEKLESVPGIESVIYWSPTMPGQVNWFTRIRPIGLSDPALEDGVVARRHHASPNGLKQLGIPLVAGRGISEEDTEETFQAVVVSESFAELVWPGGDALGKQFGTANGRTVTVVGVAADVKQQGRMVANDNSLDVYYSYLQAPRQNFLLLLRTRTDPAALTPSVQRAVRSLDPDMPIYDVMTMQDRLAQEGETTLFTTFLLSVFAGLALLLALLGIYSVLTYSVSRRCREIGIRMALGAKPAGIFRLVVGGGLKLVAAGLAVGLAASWGLTRYLSSLLFGVSPHDPATYATIAVLLTFTTILACSLPARRASQIDPMVALRYE